MIVTLPKELNITDLFSLNCDFSYSSNNGRLYVIADSYHCYSYNKKKKKYVFRGIPLNKRIADAWLSGENGLFFNLDNQNV